MKAAAAAILLAAALAGPALAEPKYSPALDKCLNAPAGMSTLGQKECIWAETKLQDGRLNREYGAAIRRLNAPQQAKLKTAQRAWIAFRDADCAAREDMDWGTLSQVNAAFCVLEMTAARADFLAGYPEP